jgi:hypothetical protein
MLRLEQERGRHEDGGDDDGAQDLLHVQHGVCVL